MPALPPAALQRTVEQLVPEAHCEMRLGMSWDQVRAVVGVQPPTRLFRAGTRATSSAFWCWGRAAGGYWLVKVWRDEVPFSPDEQAMLRTIPLLVVQSGSASGAGVRPAGAARDPGERHR